MNAGESIRTVRHCTGMTLGDAARGIGLEPARLAYLENGGSASSRTISNVVSALCRLAIAGDHLRDLEP